MPQPWFGLHPCTTADVMAAMLAAADPEAPAHRRESNCFAESPAADAAAAAAAADAARLGRYMLAWWSVAGGAVGAALDAAAYAPANVARPTAPQPPPM